MKDFDKLVEIIARLRDPVSGCPWDIKQTPQTLVPNLIEETYEVVEAIEDEDDAALSEELGDLLLHIVFQTQIASEERRFDLETVLEKINTKLTRRHPHVFGNLELGDADAVKMNWEKIKQKEKKERKSVLEGIPRALPALIYAQRTQEKAASVGFDWQDHLPVMQKLEEEKLELDEALLSGDISRVREELGDMIFTLVNLARKLHIDAEAALKDCNRKFIKRFNYIEQHYQKLNEDINEASLEELDRIWDKAKEN